MWVEVAIDESTWRLFERMCDLEGERPAESLAGHVRMALGTYLDRVSLDTDPAREAERLRLQVALRGLGEAVRQSCDYWPWNNDPAPESWEQALEDAKARGARMLEGEVLNG